MQPTYGPVAQEDLNDEIDKWGDMCTDELFRKLSSAKETLGRLRGALVVYGVHKGIYTGQKAVPTWILVTLNRITQLLNGSGTNKQLKRWLRTAWPELLEKSSSHWPSQGTSVGGDLASGDNGSRPDDPTGGEGGGIDEEQVERGDTIHDDRKGVNNEVEGQVKSHSFPQPADVSTGWKVLKEAAKNAIKEKAEQWRETLNKVRVNQHLVVYLMKDRYTIVRLLQNGRALGKDATSMGILSMERKVKISGATQESRGGDFIDSTGKEVADVDEKHPPHSRPSRNRPSESAHTRAPPIQTGTFVLKDNESVEKADVIPAESSEAGKTPSGKHDRADLTESAPMPKRTKRDNVQTSNASDSAAAPFLVSDPLEAPSATAITSSSITSTEHDGSFPTSAPYPQTVPCGVHDPRSAVSILENIVANITQQRTAVAAKITTLEQEHRWLNERLADYQIQFQQVQRRGMIQAGHFRVASSPQLPGGSAITSATETASQANVAPNEAFPGSHVFPFHPLLRLPASTLSIELMSSPAEIVLHFFKDSPVPTDTAEMVDWAEKFKEKMLVYDATRNRAQDSLDDAAVVNGIRQAAETVSKYATDEFRVWAKVSVPQLSAHMKKYGAERPTTVMGRRSDTNLRTTQPSRRLRTKVGTKSASAARAQAPSTHVDSTSVGNSISAPVITDAMEVSVDNGLTASHRRNQENGDADVEPVGPLPVPSRHPASSIGAEGDLKSRGNVIKVARSRREDRANEVDRRKRASEANVSQQHNYDDGKHRMKTQAVSAAPEWHMDHMKDIAKTEADDPASGAIVDSFPAAPREVDVDIPISNHDAPSASTVARSGKDPMEHLGSNGTDANALHRAATEDLASVCARLAVLRHQKESLEHLMARVQNTVVR
ncbi:uncharacterized protein B0H18DRAFT_1126503 [Fomitopsis serialis]|uniref:uncharacterized protein n=1 Tax=Fomitopsis serialis TaxID=139415 RepID=UPI0020079FFF|nr:uncharacterized protein B0H18DRAFT_1126503 [Neoantrodia serialis]KAH9913184.1 hypothetical protein B0H18DRAFT_1126503 [Neoantrodia serialis]